MNGSDLRFLAERASALDDRPAERLAEVHDRIALARRRRVAAVAGSAFLVVVLAVGLAVVAGGDDAETAPAPAPTADATEPQVGTCWAVPAGAAADPDYWNDDSRQVPCTEEHTTETVKVFALEDPTPDAATRLAGRCWSAVRDYLGIDRASWVPWTFLGFLPSQQQIADGASWARCDAVFPVVADYTGVRETTGSAKGIADDRPADFWGCLDQPPMVYDQPYVPCTRPHAYEQTGTLAFIGGAGEYPSRAELEREARTQCAPTLPGGSADLAVTALWDPRSSWTPYQEIAGACFVFRPDGEPLPAR